MRHRVTVGGNRKSLTLTVGSSVEVTYVVVVGAVPIPVIPATRKIPTVTSSTFHNFIVFPST